jgi:hypothetical protein
MASGMPLRLAPEAAARWHHRWARPRKPRPVRVPGCYAALAHGIPAREGYSPPLTSGNANLSGGYHYEPLTWENAW